MPCHHAFATGQANTIAIAQHPSKRTTRSFGTTIRHQQKMIQIRNMLDQLLHWNQGFKPRKHAAHPGGLRLDKVMKCDHWLSHNRLNGTVSHKTKGIIDDMHINWHSVIRHCQHHIARRIAIKPSSKHWHVLENLVGFPMKGKQLLGGPRDSMFPGASQLGQWHQPSAQRPLQFAFGIGNQHHQASPESPMCLVGGMLSDVSVFAPRWQLTIVPIPSATCQMCSSSIGNVRDCLHSQGQPAEIQHLQVSRFEFVRVHCNLHQVLITLSLKWSTKVTPHTNASINSGKELSHAGQEVAFCLRNLFLGMLQQEESHSCIVMPPAQGNVQSFAGNSHRPEVANDHDHLINALNIQEVQQTQPSHSKWSKHHLPRKVGCKTQSVQHQWNNLLLQLLKLARCQVDDTKWKGHAWIEHHSVVVPDLSPIARLFEQRSVSHFRLFHQCFKLALLVGCWRWKGTQQALRFVATALLDLDWCSRVIHHCHFQFFIWQLQHWMTFVCEVISVQHKITLVKFQCTTIRTQDAIPSCQIVGSLLNQTGSRAGGIRIIHMGMTIIHKAHHFHF